MSASEMNESNDLHKRLYKVMVSENNQIRLPVQEQVSRQHTYQRRLITGKEQTELVVRRKRGSIPSTLAYKGDFIMGPTLRDF